MPIIRPTPTPSKASKAGTVPSRVEMPVPVGTPRPGASRPSPVQTADTGSRVRSPSEQGKRLAEGLPVGRAVVTGDVNRPESETKPAKAPAVNEVSANSLEVAFTKAKNRLSSGATKVWESAGMTIPSGPEGAREGFETFVVVVKYTDMQKRIDAERSTDPSGLLAEP